VDHRRRMWHRRHGGWSEARFNQPIAVTVDASDDEAGPQLIIADYGNQRVRCLNLRTETITTLTGGPTSVSPPRPSFIPYPRAVAVAPNGVVFVGSMSDNGVWRISRAPAERMAGSPRVVSAIPVVGFAASIECFRMVPARPWSL
jgi:hypothetical protein